MISYEVILGVDRAARDTGRRIRMQVRERDPLSAAIVAEQRADNQLTDPVEYTHAMHVRAFAGPAAMAISMPRMRTLALAA